MQDDIKAESPGALLASIREGIRKDVRAEIDEDYTERLRAAHSDVRKAQDLADVRKICAEKELIATRSQSSGRGPSVLRSAISL